MNLRILLNILSNETYGKRMWKKRNREGDREEGGCIGFVFSLNGERMLPCVASHGSSTEGGPGRTQSLEVIS